MWYTYFYFLWSDCLSGCTTLRCVSPVCVGCFSVFLVSFMYVVCITYARLAALLFLCSYFNACTAKFGSWFPVHCSFSLYISCYLTLCLCMGGYLYFWPSLSPSFADPRLSVHVCISITLHLSLSSCLPVRLCLQVWFSVNDSVRAEG